MERKMSVGSFSSPKSIFFLFLPLPLSLCYLRGIKGEGGGGCFYVLSFLCLFNLLILFWVLQFSFGFCDPVSSSVILFWVFRSSFGILWFCFAFCDFVLDLWFCFGFYVRVFSLSVTVKSTSWKEFKRRSSPFLATIWSVSRQTLRTAVYS